MEEKAKTLPPNNTPDWVRRVDDAIANFTLRPFEEVDAALRAATARWADQPTLPPEDLAELDAQLRVLEEEEVAKFNAQVAEELAMVTEDVERLFELLDRRYQRVAA
ncbi:MAG: hypothetical protein LBN05_05190 [Oscillospiraceae bacterium]|jgi:hypothetical protein|nr:hypothetical protein [Oscillospiraceae bacterium]